MDLYAPSYPALNSLASLICSSRYAEGTKFVMSENSAGFEINPVQRFRNLGEDYTVDRNDKKYNAIVFDGNANRLSRYRPYAKKHGIFILVHRDVVVTLTNWGFEIIETTDPTDPSRMASISSQ